MQCPCILIGPPDVTGQSERGTAALTQCPSRPFNGWSAGGSDGGGGGGKLNRDNLSPRANGAAATPRGAAATHPAGWASAVSAPVTRRGISSGMGGGRNVAWETGKRRKKVVHGARGERKRARKGSVTDYYTTVWLACLGYEAQHWHSAPVALPSPSAYHWSASRYFSTPATPTFTSRHPSSPSPQHQTLNSKRSSAHTNEVLIVLNHYANCSPHPPSHAAAPPRHRFLLTPPKYAGLCGPSTGPADPSVRPSVTPTVL